MDNVERYLCHFGNRNGTIDSFRFHTGWAGQSMPFRFGVAVSNCFLDDFINHDPVFRMHADPCSIFSGLPEGTVEGSIIHIQHSGVGHEELV